MPWKAWSSSCTRCHHSLLVRTFLVYPICQHRLIFDVVLTGNKADGTSSSGLGLQRNHPSYLKSHAEIISPAVAGTLNILRSAQKHQSTVRRIVITGSICAVLSWPTVTPNVYDEASVNEASVQAVEEGSIDPIAIYCTAKTQSEERECLQKTVGYRL